MQRMNFLKACSIAGLVWGLTGTAAAQVPQSPDLPATRDVYFTFSQAVMVPNETLPAGKYLFRVTGQGRNIVEIYSADKSRMIRRVMAVHAARSDSPERAEIRLIEGSANAPVAIGTWWYPLQRQGWEFIYPREQATKLAKTSTQPILTTAENVPADKIDPSSELVRLEPTGAQSDYAPSAQPTQVRGTAQVGEMADADANANQVAAAMSGQNAQSSATMARADGAAGRTSLPRTASSTPTVALIGLLALAAGLALGFRRSHA